MGLHWHRAIFAFAFPASCCVVFRPSLRSFTLSPDYFSSPILWSLPMLPQHQRTLGKTCVFVPPVTLQSHKHHRTEPAQHTHAHAHALNTHTHTHTTTNITEKRLGRRRSLSTLVAIVFAARVVPWPLAFASILARNTHKKRSTARASAGDYTDSFLLD